MVYRLLARYRINPAPSELLPKREGRVLGTHRLDDEVEGIVQGLIQSFYLKRQRPRVIDLYRQVAFSCRTASLPTPSYKAIQTRVEVSTVPVLLGVGVPLLSRVDQRTGLKLTKHKVYRSGIVSLDYEIQVKS
jgi:hypothetical protein